MPPPLFSPPARHDIFATLSFHYCCFRYEFIFAITLSPHAAMPYAIISLLLIRSFFAAIPLLLLMPPLRYCHYAFIDAVSLPFSLSPRLPPSAMLAYAAIDDFRLSRHVSLRRR